MSLRRWLGCRGLALPSAMFALVALSVLVVGLFTFTDLGAKAGRNREQGARALQLADAGLAHAVGTLRGPLRIHHYTRLLRGSDSLVPTGDDSLIIGWGLVAAEQIPAGGKAILGGTYYATVRDDPADGDGNAFTDMNGRVLVRCRAVTSEGAVAVIDAIVGAVPYPGVAANGDLTFSGTPSIRGPCGGAHANGDLRATGTRTIVETQATSTGSTSGNFKLPDGTTNAPELSGQDSVKIPALSPPDYCAGADYLLRADGFIVPAATGIPVDARSVEVFGWKRGGGPPEVKWNLNGDLSVDGTFCVEGNALVGGNTGTAAVPRKMSIIATGSIEVSGNPYMTAEHDEDIMLLAGGDVSITGNPAVGSDNFGGLIYAGAQCNVTGDPVISGQIVCADGAQPPNSINFQSTHVFSGNFTVRFDCSANIWNKRRVLFWYPRFGN